MTQQENAACKEPTSEIVGRIAGGGHLFTIRTALKQGHAAVMIGSGFSLNAKGGNRLPLWGKLIDGLLEDVYPDEAARESAKGRFGGTSGMLRLAEEYVAVLDRARLEAKLHQLLPDAGVVFPGDVHRKLLALNWTDVFTTNYDTLLERTLDADRSALLPTIKSRYQVVVAARDVPYSKRDGRPRIVKLHGSLRSGSKLIVTESDYREYPKDYASFVNTVQQSMLENVFVLIGFSGDDPNFLAWAGWVRDHLRENAPPLYLITFRPVPEGQRILLEKRKIFSISIAELNGSKDVRDYAKALTALLSFWRDDPPVRTVEWPYESNVQILPPMSANSAQLGRWLAEVQRNRAEYPGWIIAPADCRRRALDSRVPAFAIQAFEALRESLPHWLRLVFLDELVWLIDVTLSPFPENAARLIEDELADRPLQDAVSFGHQTLNSDENFAVRYKDHSILKANLAFALLRNAREANDDIMFEEWYERLKEEKFGKLSIEQRCGLLYENILFKLERRAREEALLLVQELEQLSTRALDSYWPIRVGALFGELGHLRKGFNRVRDGLRSIREAIQFEGEKVPLVSREQWAEWLYSTLRDAVKGAESISTRGDKIPWSPEPGLRVEADSARGAHNYNPNGIDATDDDAGRREGLDQKIVRDEEARDSIEHPTFIMDEARAGVHEAVRLLQESAVSIDAESVPDDRTMPGLVTNAKASALRYVRLTERVSLPPVLGGVAYSAKTIAFCFRILSTSGGQTSSLRLLLRACDGLGTSMDELDLATVSALKQTLAKSVFENALTAINSLAVDMELDAQGAATLKALMELVSRLAFRLDPEDAETACNVAIKLYSSRALQRNYSIHIGYSNFFARAVRLLPKACRSAVIPRIIALALVDFDTLDVMHLWLNPVSLLGPPSNDVGPTEVVAILADEILVKLSVSVDKTIRARHIAALDWLYKGKLLTRNQENLFAQKLWEGVALNSHPIIHGFYHYAFLSWPTMPGRPKRDELFKKWVVQLECPDIVREEEFAGRKQKFALLPNDLLVTSLTYGAILPMPVRWEGMELMAAVLKVRTWWTREGVSFFEKVMREPSSDGLDGLMLGHRLRAISYFCLRVLRPNLSLAMLQTQRLDVWFAELWDASVLLELPATAFLFAGLHWWPDKSNLVIDRIVNILESNSNREVTADALQMANEWLCQHQRPSVQTSRLVHYLINSLRSGPDFLVEQKLGALRHLLSKASTPHIEPYLETLSGTLCSLLDDLRSGAASRSRRVNFYATPLLRVAVAKTLKALKERVPHCVLNENWRAAADIVRTDPILLVRNQLG